MDPLALVFGEMEWKTYCQETCVQHAELEESVGAVIQISEHLFEVVVELFRDCLRLAIRLEGKEDCMAHVGLTRLSEYHFPKVGE
jgi:hypothetical protein